jgi:hypothetical protein
MKVGEKSDISTESENTLLVLTWQNTVNSGDVLCKIEK